MELTMANTPTRDLTHPYLVKPWYDFQQQYRRYHNFAHAEYVVAAVHELTPEPSKEVILAAWWHDAVYVPGAGSDANERASAAALIHTAKRLGVHSPYVVVAGYYVRSTHLENHLCSDRQYGDLAILLDADLKSLATDYDTFVANQKNIIAENLGSPDSTDDLAKCAEFLTVFLSCREHIYHTVAGRQLWEDSAHANIERFSTETRN